MEKKNNLENLKEYIFSSNNCWLEVEYNSITYDFYFAEEKLIYASNSALPSERLDRHLKRLTYIDKTIDKKVRNQAHSQVENLNKESASLPAEYLVIEWLINKSIIQQETGKLLLSYLTKEVCESFLLITNLTKDNFRQKKHRLSFLFQFDLDAINKECDNNLENWKLFSKQIQSLYQRPYLFKIDEANKQISLEQQKKLSSILKGFNFLQLEAILNQDKLEIAKKLYPLIVSKTVILREPQPPFNKLPNFDKLLKSIKNKPDKNITKYLEKDEDKEITISSITPPISNQKAYKIVCVDDSPVILQSITNFLSQDNLTVVPVNNAAKALIMITKVKPDLILMDIGMPNIDGYQLCTLIRKHSIFHDTPIIMVTGNKGIINRAKAKLSGATDYMTKPFTQEDLLTMVFRYLSD